MTKKIAFVFPGQGSQQVGMLDSIAGDPLVQATLDEANDALGFDLASLIAKGPESELALTVNTQPALVVASTAMYRFYRAKGGRLPDIVAGHSLGEYSALVAAGALGFTEAVKLVRFRAEQMQAAVPVGLGGMAVILGLSDETVKGICADCSKDGLIVEAVNFNTPGQVVIAGDARAVEEARKKATELKARRALPLNVSGPFHSSLMAPAAKAMKERLTAVEFLAPKIPVLHNVDVKSHTTSEEIRTALSEQVESPVLWSATIVEMEAMGVQELYEVGPGTALSGMVKRITKNITAFALNDRSSLEEAALKNQEQ